MIIGEERPERKMLQSKTPRAATKISTLERQDKGKKTGSNLAGQAGSSSGLTSHSGGLTGVQTGLTGASNNSGNFFMAKFRTRPSFKELLAKYQKEGAV